MSDMKTRDEIKKAVEGLKNQLQSPTLHGSVIATLNSQITELEKVLALEGDLEQHRSALEAKYFELDMDESQVYSWVLGESDIFDEFLDGYVFEG